LEYGIPNSEDSSEAARRQAGKNNDRASDIFLMLLIAIANINVWNRLNVATRQPAGVWKP
jgi:hypothetical protein